MSWKTKRVGVAECVMCFPEVPTKQRPKFDTKRFRTYTPDKTRHAEKSIKRQWEAAVGDRWKDFATEVRVFIEVQRPLAKSNPKYWAGRPDLMKPDADNLAKVICDSLNGLAYRDDCQITQLGVTFDPRTPYSDECLIRVRVEYYSERYEKEAKLAPPPSRPISSSTPAREGPRTFSSRFSPRRRASTTPSSSPADGHADHRDRAAGTRPRRVQEYEVEPLPLDDEPIERPANVDAETGEIYDPIDDEARMLGEGSN